MAEHEGERQRPRGVLLVGSGRRAREVGGVLAAVSTLDAEGERKREPPEQVELADLEGLLAPRPSEGILILESGRVPGEDIGFVRRFLERHLAWRLLVLGEDPAEARARALLALPRAQFLAWPPDLEELRAASFAPLAREGARDVARDGARARQGDERAAPRRGRRAGAQSSGAVDLGELLEELFAGAALSGAGTPRFQFAPKERVLVQRERAALHDGLGGLVELARVCAGDDGLVRAALEPNGESVLVTLEFPRAELPEKEPGALLERSGAAQSSTAQSGGAQLGAGLAAALAAARNGARLLRDAGGRVELASAEPGRLRWQVRLASERQAAAPRPARAGKPEDPFA